jgi:hypothetical protein
MLAHRKQFNLIVNNALEAKMIRLANRVGASGYSIFPMTSGKGEQGNQSASDGDGSILFMTILSLDKVDTMIEEIQKIQTRGYPMTVYINDVYSLNPHDLT